MHKDHLASYICCVNIRYSEQPHETCCLFGFQAEKESAQELAAARCNWEVLHKEESHELRVRLTACLYALHIHVTLTSGLVPDIV